MIAGITKTSPIVIFLESAAAVSQGGRTGLGAVVASALFAASIFAVPLLVAVPVSATGAVTVLVGSFMMGAALSIPWDRVDEALPAFITIAMTAFSCSISNGLVAGFIFYGLLGLPFAIAKVSGWHWLRARLMASNPEFIAADKESYRQLEATSRMSPFYHSAGHGSLSLTHASTISYEPAAASGLPHRLAAREHCVTTAAAPRGKHESPQSQGSTKGSPKTAAVLAFAWV